MASKPTLLQQFPALVPPTQQPCVSVDISTAPPAQILHEFDEELDNLLRGNVENKQQQQHSAGNTAVASISTNHQQNAPSAATYTHTHTHPHTPTQAPWACLLDNLIATADGNSSQQAQNGHHSMPDGNSSQQAQNGHHSMPAPALLPLHGILNSTIAPASATTNCGTTTPNSTCSDTSDHELHHDPTAEGNTAMSFTRIKHEKAPSKRGNSKLKLQKLVKSIPFAGKCTHPTDKGLDIPSLSALSNGQLPQGHRPARGRGRQIQLASMTPTQRAAEKHARLEKNRMAAKDFRIRRRNRILELEEKVSVCEGELAMKGNTIQQMQETIDLLRAQLSHTPPSSPPMFYHEDPSEIAFR